MICFDIRERLLSEEIYFVELKKKCSLY